MYSMSIHSFKEGSIQPMVPVSGHHAVAEGDTRPRQGGITVTFPMKLHSMLTEIQADGSPPNVIGWSASGDAFVISNPKAFTHLLLPRYFRTHKFSSFQRQLNAYGFVRGNLYAGQEDVHIYYHEIFHRDHADRTKDIRRRGSLTGKKRQDRRSLEATPVDEIPNSSRSLLMALASIDLPTSFGYTGYTGEGLITDLIMSTSGGGRGGYESSPDSEGGFRRDSVFDEAVAAVAPAGDEETSQSNSPLSLSDWNPEMEQLMLSEDECVSR